MVIKMLRMAPEHPLRSPGCIEHPGRLAEGVGAWGPEQVAVPWEPPQARTCHSLPSHKRLSGWPAARGPCWRETQVYPNKMSFPPPPPRKIPPFREDWPLLESACKTCQPIRLLCFQMLQPTSPSLQQAKQGMWCHRLLGTVIRIRLRVHFKLCKGKDHCVIDVFCPQSSRRTRRCTVKLLIHIPRLQSAIAPTHTENFSQLTELLKLGGCQVGECSLWGFVPY